MSVKGCLGGKKTERSLQSNWTTPKFTFITTMSTSETSVDFTVLNRCLSVFIDPEVGKNTCFCFLP